MMTTHDVDKAPSGGMSPTAYNYVQDKQEILKNNLNKVVRRMKKYAGKRQRGGVPSGGQTQAEVHTLADEETLSQGRTL